MKNNKIIGIVALFVVALVAIVCVLVYKYVDGSKKEETTASASAEATANVTEPVTEYYEIPSATQAVTEPASENTTAQPETIVTAPSDAITELSTQPVTKPVTNSDFNKVFKMPVAPQYVEPNVNVDFEELSKALNV